MSDIGRRLALAVAVLSLGAPLMAEELVDALLERGRDYGVELVQRKGVRCPCIVLDASREGQKLGQLEIKSFDQAKATAELEQKIFALLAEKGLHRSDTFFFPDRGSVYAYIGANSMQFDQNGGVLRTRGNEQDLGLFDGLNKGVEFKIDKNNADILNVYLEENNGSICRVKIVSGRLGPIDRIVGRGGKQIEWGPDKGCGL